MPAAYVLNEGKENVAAQASLGMSIRGTGDP